MHKEERQFSCDKTDNNDNSLNSRFNNKLLIKDTTF